MAEELDSRRAKFPPARWAVPGMPVIVFPVESVEVEYEKRLVQHERAYREGARLDDTAGKAKSYTFSIAFFNAEDHEQGLSPGPMSQYPDAADALERSFEAMEVGDLTVPTKGLVRARAWKFRRRDDISEIDSASVVCTFLVDNEDDAAAAAAQQPSAHTVVKAQADAAVDFAEEVGATSFDLAQLAELAAQLEDLATAPGRFVADLEAKANAVQNLALRVHNTFTGEAAAAKAELGTLLTDPASSRAGKALARVADTAARVLGDRHGHQGRIIGRTFDQDLSIFDVALRVKQEAPDLMAINTQLADLLHITAGTPVRIFDRSEA